MRYILLFRLLGLLAHLVNIQLVFLILRKMERSPRMVILGTMLYAWNPLVLLESSQGAHNDIFMITFILLGIFFLVQVEKETPMRWRSAILPIVALTLAALVKYTTIPLVALAIIMLVFRALRADTSGSHKAREMIARRWKPALLVGLTGCITSGIVILAFYGPFFFGHSFRAIVDSFTNPPSSRGSHKSILDAIVLQLTNAPPPPHTWLHGLLSRLSSLKLWDLINIITLAGDLIIDAIWLWRKPTTRTFVLASLLTLGAFLLVAPWFLPWYATWLVALAAVSLPVSRSPIARGLVAFALTFSVSVFILYLYNGHPPYNIWNLLSCLYTFVPPVVAFFIALLPWPRIARPVMATA